MKTRFKIKYGLPTEPTDADIALWQIRYLRHKNDGMSSEKAGHEAASETFEGYQTCKYASQADTIEALLAEVGNKDK